jgi:hypothetical protein
VRRLTGHDRRQRVPGLRPGENILVLTLMIGLAAVALAAVAVGTFVGDVTHGDGVAVIDHPVAGFVTTSATEASAASGQQATPLAGS